MASPAAPWNEVKQILTARKDGTTIKVMNDQTLFVAALFLIMPFMALIIAANMKRSHERYLRKLAQRANKKNKTKIR